MNNKEREAIEKYVLEVFHYEHQCSTEILARMMLLCELLIEKRCSYWWRSYGKTKYGKYCWDNEWIELWRWYLERGENS